MRCAPLLALAACSSPAPTRPDDAAPTPFDASPSCAEATQHSDLTWLQANVFSKSCTFSSCHKGTASSAGGLNLEPGRAYDNLVDQPSDLAEGWKLVVPGSPDQSYLLVMLGHRPGPVDPVIGYMPYNNQRLCEQKLEALTRWIAEGAIDPRPDAMPPDAMPPDAMPPDAAPADAAPPDAAPP